MDLPFTSSLSSASSGLSGPASAGLGVLLVIVLVVLRRRIRNERELQETIDHANTISPINQEKDRSSAEKSFLRWFEIVLLFLLDLKLKSVILLETIC